MEFRLQTTPTIRFEPIPYDDFELELGIFDLEPICIEIYTRVELRGNIKYAGLRYWVIKGLNSEEQKILKNWSREGVLPTKTVEIIL